MSSAPTPAGHAPVRVIAQNAGKRFAGGVQALAGVDLEVEAGQFASIVGPSGCGKSTLLRLVAGLAELTSGTLSVDGRPPLETRRTRRDLAYVFQEPTLLPWRTLERNVALPLELRGQQDQGRVAQILEMVGLKEFARAYPHQLSGGMRMRASIARALIVRPGLLLLDEPFGALDELTRQRLNEELLRLWEKDRWTGLFVTHNVYEAVFLSQRVLVMSARPGRLIADLEVPFPHPRDPELRTAPEFNRLAAQISHELAKALQ
jgi:NitT/TauT family transport system ATP-binding protein